MANNRHRDQGMVATHCAGTLRIRTRVAALILRARTVSTAGIKEIIAYLKEEEWLAKNTLYGKVVKELRSTA